MPRTFAYLRISTAGQTADNQLAEIQAVGFARLLDRLEAGNVQANADMCGRSMPQAGSPRGGY